MKTISSKLVLALTLSVATGYSVAAHNDNEKANLPITNHEEHNQKMNACIKTALERHPGAVVEVEFEQEDGKLIYDVDVQGKDGKVWEVECDAASGQVLEDKEEVEDKDEAEGKHKGKH